MWKGAIMSVSKWKYVYLYDECLDLGLPQATSIVLDHLMWENEKIIKYW